MSDSLVVDSIASVIRTLNKVSALYDTIKGDTDLPAAFHTVGGSLGPVQQTLEVIQAQSKCVRLAGNIDDVVRSLGEYNEKAKLLEDILGRVAPQSQTSRRARYYAAVREQGRGAVVEVLMMGIVEETSFLAEDSAIKAATEPHVMALRNEMDKLSDAEQSVPDNLLKHSDAQNTGIGTQGNSMGSGQQLFHVSGSVNFGLPRGSQ